MEGGCGWALISACILSENFDERGGKFSSSPQFYSPLGSDVMAPDVDCSPNPPRPIRAIMMPREAKKNSG